MWGFRRVLVALVGLITLARLEPRGVPKAVAYDLDLGCGTACQSAGQYGAPALPPSPITILSTGTVTPDPDGYGAGHADRTSSRSNPRVGDILLELAGFDNPHDRLPFVTGRSDLLVRNGSATRTIGVPAPAEAIAYVRSNGPTPVQVLGDVNGADERRGTLTLAAPG